MSGGGAQQAVIAQVGRVRGHAGGDAAPGAPLPALGEGGRLGERLEAPLRERAPPQVGPGARFLDGARHLVHEDELVGHRGDAPLDHLDEAEHRAPVHVLRGELALQGPDELGEPALERHVLGQSAPEHRGHVRLGVDEPGQGQHPLPLEHLEARRERLPGGADVRDAPRVDEDVLVARQGERALGAGDEGVAVTDAEVRHRRLVLGARGKSRPPPDARRPRG